jgi:hypothetical protein
MVTVIATFDYRKLIRCGSWPSVERGPHRWAPEAGYVTLVANNEKDLEPAMELIRLSHGYFGGEANGLPMGQQRNE